MEKTVILLVVVILVVLLVIGFLALVPMHI